MSKIKALFWLLIGILLTTSAFAAGPVISGIAVSSVTSNSAVIVWTTSPAATSQVFYGVGNTSQSSAKSFALVTSHSITIAVLSQQTVYTYEVQSTDSGGSTTSSTNTFALCNPGNPNSGYTSVSASENAAYATGTVTATWTDNSGVSTSTPTVCGNTFLTTQTATVGLPGNLVMSLPDNNYIIPSPSSWTFTQSNASGLSANEAVTGSTIDLTTAFGLQASSSSGGGGVSSFFGNTGNITALVDPTNIVDAGGNSILFSSAGVGFFDTPVSEDSDGCIANSALPGLICSDKVGDQLLLSSGQATMSDFVAGNRDICTLHAGSITCTDLNSDVFSVSDGVITLEANGNSGDELQINGPNTNVFNSLNIMSQASVGAIPHLLFSATAPTISSGFGTSPTISHNNGTEVFTVNVGTGGTATSGVIAFPTASNGWHVECNDITTQSATVFLTRQTGTSTTTATIVNFTTAGTAGAWVASDILSCSAWAY